MTLTVRCFLCGENAVRLIMGGRQILQARCRACGENVLAEVMALEQDTYHQQSSREREITANNIQSVSRDERHQG